MHNPPLILIADDNETNRDILRTRLRSQGYELLEAGDGQEALSIAWQHHPDLILLDVMMPKIDGFSICKQIRANPEWKDMRIIMLTARGRDVEREKGLALGADDYITKPFSTKDAIARVEAMLGRPRKAEGQ
jgi:DNA-binding response OmpR family regulator